VLQRAGLSPHNGKTKTFNCKGFASCGTCAVAVDGEVSDMGIREKGRLLAPPHHPNYDLRLSCQTKVLGDVEVEKYPGNWGTKIAKGPLPPVDEASSERAETEESTFKKESADQPTE
jgi:ferredoxin